MTAFCRTTFFYEYNISKYTYFSEPLYFNYQYGSEKWDNLHTFYDQIRGFFNVSSKFLRNFTKKLRRNIEESRELITAKHLQLSNLRRAFMSAQRHRQGNEGASVQVVAANYPRRACMHANSIGMATKARLYINLYPPVEMRLFL